jgi:LemA protein
MDVIIYIIGGGVIVSVVVVWLVYNRLMALDERCNTAFADVDVQLKHRHNLVPGLVETVRGFVGHELTVLTEVTVGVVISRQGIHDG